MFKQQPDRRNFGSPSGKVTNHRSKPQEAETVPPTARVLSCPGSAQRCQMSVGAQVPPCTLPGRFLSHLVRILGAAPQGISEGGLASSSWFYSSGSVRTLVFQNVEKGHLGCSVSRSETWVPTPRATDASAVLSPSFFSVSFEKVQVMTHKIDLMTDQGVAARSSKSRTDLTQ